LITELVEALKDKNIDVSEFSPDEMEEYERICKAIQDILYAITNGNGLTDLDWEFLNSLQEKSTN